MRDADKQSEPGRLNPAVTVPAGLEDAYERLAASSAILGKGLEELAHAAMMLEVPDPAALGAAGYAWPELEKVGTVLRGWAGLVRGSLPKQPAPAGGLIVVERKLDRP